QPQVNCTAPLATTPCSWISASTPATSPSIVHERARPLPRSVRYSPSPAGPWQRLGNMELVAEAVAPFHGQLMVKPLAWTPSTKGVVTAQVVLLDPPGLVPPRGGGFNFFGGPPPPPEPKWAAPPMPPAKKSEEPQQPTQAEL